MQKNFELTKTSIRKEIKIKNLKERVHAETKLYANRVPIDIMSINWLRSNKRDNKPAKSPVSNEANIGVFNLGMSVDKKLNNRPSDAILYTTLGIGNIEAYKLKINLELFYILNFGILKF